MKRGVHPTMQAYLKLKNYIGGKIGNKGPLASIVANIYIQKVKGEMEKVEKYKEAKKLFDDDNQGNIDRNVETAKQRLAEARKNRKPRKKRKKKTE